MSQPTSSDQTINYQIHTHTHSNEQSSNKRKTRSNSQRGSTIPLNTAFTHIKLRGKC